LFFIIKEGLLLFFLFLFYCKFFKKMSNIINNNAQPATTNPAPAHTGTNGSTSAAPNLGPANISPAAAPTAPAVWTENTINLLINQRKHRNVEFHRIIGGKSEFWASVARRINRSADTTFTGMQCKRKFQNMVSTYYVSKIDI
jgi:hypothetical protein